MKQRILLTGKDGLDLLQRITTIDLQQLGASPAVGLILNPQGKIQSYFEIKLGTPGSVEMLATDQFLALLDQYTFSERYQLQKEAVADDTTFQPELTPLERITQLIPKLGYEFLEDAQTNPLEVNLRSAIHDNKGCYPGQEVIEKIISLGSPPKKLCLLEMAPTAELSLTEVQTKLADAIPRALLDPETQAEVGTLTSFSENVGLAILKRTHQKPGQIFALNGSSLRLSLKQVQS